MTTYYYTWNSYKQSVWTIENDEVKHLAYDLEPKERKNLFPNAVYNCPYS